MIPSDYLMICTRATFVWGCRCAAFSISPLWPPPRPDRDSYGLLSVLLIPLTSEDCKFSMDMFFLHDFSRTVKTTGKPLSNFQVDLARAPPLPLSPRKMRPNASRLVIYGLVIYFAVFNIALFYGYSTVRSIIAKVSEFEGLFAVLGNFEFNEKGFNRLMESKGMPPFLLSKSFEILLFILNRKRTSISLSLCHPLCSFLPMFRPSDDNICCSEFAPIWQSFMRQAITHTDRVVSVALDDRGRASKTFFDVSLDGEFTYSLSIHLPRLGDIASPLRPWKPREIRGPLCRFDASRQPVD